MSDARRASVLPDAQAMKESFGKASKASKGAEKVNDNVRVICRVRPFNSREIDIHEQSQAHKESYDRDPIRSILEFNHKQCIFCDHEKDFAEKETFTFDRCYWSIPDEQQISDTNPFATQTDVFNGTGQDILTEVWKGFNTCFFAYGQTGSGKTFSMMGADGEDGAGDPGLIPRLCKQLFETMEEKAQEAEGHKDTYVSTFKVHVRYMEIYNEQVKDLLWHLSTLPPELKAKANPDNMKIRSSPATGVFIENLTAVEVDGWQRCVDLINCGNNARHVAATQMNARSSRSHAIFKISLTQVQQFIPKKQFDKPTEHVRESQINLVDLAGSERIRKTGAVGERLKEAANINKSLTTLKMVIDTLVDNATSKKQKMPPFRDSHLTTLLADSLGGNSKTFMLVCVSPHSDNSEETMQTLRYGSRARQIVNVAHVNENAAGRKMLDLEGELEKMKNDLASGCTPEQAENLKSCIKQHEDTMNVLKSEMEEQQRRIEGLREEKDRHSRSRQLAVFHNLHRLTKAQVQREEAGSQQRKLERRLSMVRRGRVSLEERSKQADKDVETLTGLIEEHRMQTEELNHQIDHYRDKERQLERYKRELQTAVGDQELEIHALREQKIAAVMRSKLDGIRSGALLRKHMREQKDKHDVELREIVHQGKKEHEKHTKDNQSRMEDLHDEQQILQQEQQAAHDGAKSLEREKNAQIQQLQREVELLRAEIEQKIAEHEARLITTNEEWEDKYQVMVAEMEGQLADVGEQWDTRHQGDIRLKEADFQKQQDRWRTTVSELNTEWKDRLDTVVAEGTARCQTARSEWKATFSEKMNTNRDLKFKLTNIVDGDEKYAELHRMAPAIAAAVSSGQVRLSNPKDTEPLLELLEEYAAEYEKHKPNRYQLQQLLRGDYTHKRCDVVPGSNPKTKTVHQGTTEAHQPRVAVSYKAGAALARRRNAAGSSA